MHIFEVLIIAGHYLLLEYRNLFIFCQELFCSQAAVYELSGSISICGPIEGQYADLLNIFQACGLPTKTRYLFLGGIIGRNRNCVDVLTLLLLFLLRFSHNVLILRDIGERRFRELDTSLIIKGNGSPWRGIQSTNGNRQLIINSAPGISRTRHNYGVVLQFGEDKKTTFKQIEKNEMVTKEDIKFAYRSI